MNQTEKANGIAHEYAWLDKDPDVLTIKGIFRIYASELLKLKKHVLL